MKEVIQGIAVVLIGTSMVLGALLVYGRAQYEFRYNFGSITLGTHSSGIVRMLGDPEGKVQSLVISSSEDPRDNYTNTVTYQPDFYLFWRQSGVTYYVGFDTDNTVTMTVVRFPNGEDHVCLVKGRERNRYKYCDNG